MARLPRSLTVRPGFAVHKIWRGHNRESNLKEDTDKGVYLGYLNDELDEAEEDHIVLRALTLMSNHTHEVFHVQDQKQLSSQMRRHHSRYGAYFNRKNARCGKVAQDRPRTCLIGDDHHEMRTTFYVHANPIRAKMVRDASQYRWSTHKLYAFGKQESWMKNVELPDWYLKLGKTPEDRQRKYRRLFAQYLRREGLEKRHFLERPFYGPVVWMASMNQTIRDWRRSLAPPD